MKSIRIAGLCFASMLVLGMALASTASAAPLWLVCLEGSGLTKYSTNQCTTASGTGAWQSLGLPAGQTDTVRIQVFSLHLEDTGTLAGKSAIECNSTTADEGTGFIEGTGKGKITAAGIKETEINTRCKVIEGGCETGKIEKVKAVHLPWATEIFETESKLETKIENSGAGEPGWSITCHTALGSQTDECVSTGSTKLESASLANAVTAGVLLVKGTFLGAHPAKCTQSSSHEDGHVRGLVAILLNSGNGLSVNPV